MSRMTLKRRHVVRNSESCRRPTLTTISTTKCRSPPLWSRQRLPVMHPLFAIAELVGFIVLQLAPSDDDVITNSFQPVHFTCLDQDSYHALTSLGLTASVFREASLDALWRNQCTLVPLLRASGMNTRTFVSQLIPSVATLMSTVSTALLQTYIRRRFPYSQSIRFAHRHRSVIRTSYCTTYRSQRM